MKPTAVLTGSVSARAKVLRSFADFGYEAEKCNLLEKGSACAMRNSYHQRLPGYFAETVREYSEKGTGMVKNSQ